MHSLAWGTIYNTRKVIGHEKRINSLWYISPIRNPILSSSNVTGQGPTLQQLHPTGQNLTQFLLEKNTADPGQGINAKFAYDLALDDYRGYEPFEAEGMPEFGYQSR